MRRKEGRERGEAESGGKQKERGRELEHTKERTRK
jgi:hypothetical protein